MNSNDIMLRIIGRVQEEDEVIFSIAQQCSQDGRPISFRAEIVIKDNTMIIRRLDMGLMDDMFSYTYDDTTDTFDVKNFTCSKFQLLTDLVENIPRVAKEYLGIGDYVGIILPIGQGHVFTSKKYELKI